ncbi:hypothetical protein BH24CHL4_BH24CHL4_05460 [soil metagenome]
MANVTRHRVGADIDDFPDAATGLVMANVDLRSRRTETRIDPRRRRGGRCCRAPSEQSLKELASAGRDCQFLGQFIEPSSVHGALQIRNRRRCPGADHFFN